MHAAGTAVPGHGLYCVLALLCARLFAFHRVALRRSWVALVPVPGPASAFARARRVAFRARLIAYLFFVLFCLMSLRGTIHASSE